MGTHSGKQVEVKRIITQREYNTAYKNRDMSRHVVKQKRISFIWNMQSFNIHIYMEPTHVENLCLVHVQTSGDVDKDSDASLVDMPDFLDVQRKLVDCEEDKKRFGAFSISLR